MVFCEVLLGRTSSTEWLGRDELADKAEVSDITEAAGREPTELSMKVDWLDMDSRLVDEVVRFVDTLLIGPSDVSASSPLLGRFRGFRGSGLAMTPGRDHSTEDAVRLF